MPSQFIAGPGGAAAGADVAVLVGGDFNAAYGGGWGGDLAAGGDGAPDLERLGAFHQGVISLTVTEAERGALDAAGIERPGGRVVLDDCAIRVFDAVEVAVVVVGQWLGCASW